MVANDCKVFVDGIFKISFESTLSYSILNTKFALIDCGIFLTFIKISHFHSCFSTCFYKCISYRTLFWFCNSNRSTSSSISRIYSRICVDACTRLILLLFRIYLTFRFFKCFKHMFIWKIIASVIIFPDFKFILITHYQLKCVNTRRSPQYFSSRPVGYIVVEFTDCMLMRNGMITVVNWTLVCV